MHFLSLSLAIDVLAANLLLCHGYIPGTWRPSCLTVDHPGFLLVFQPNNLRPSKRYPSPKLANCIKKPCFPHSKTIDQINIQVDSRSVHWGFSIILHISKRLNPIISSEQLARCCPVQRSPRDWQRPNSPGEKSKQCLILLNDTEMFLL